MGVVCRVWFPSILATVITTATEKLTNQPTNQSTNEKIMNVPNSYRVLLSVLDPRKCEYLKDYSLDFEHAYMTTFLAS